MQIVRPEPRQEFPADAQKVFGGVLYDVYQWPQKMFDGSTRTFEHLRRGDSVVIIPVTDTGKIVVMRERQPGTDWYLAVPCGGIESGEEPSVAATRELLEETGYKPTQLDFWFAGQVEHRVDWAIFVFVARGCVRTLSMHDDGGEQIELREVSLEEFLRLASDDQFQNINLAPKLLRAALDPVEMKLLRERFGLPT